MVASNKGENAYNWKQNPGYRTLHKWVNRNKPKPACCEECKKVTTHLECANINEIYNRDLDNYRWLCRKCHMKSDGRHNNLLQGGFAIEVAAKEISSGYKTCIYCKVKKPISEIAKNKYRKSGLQSYCKVCSNKKNREWERRKKVKS